MERVKIIALIRLVDDDKPGVVDKYFKEPLIADKHILWEEIMKFFVQNGIVGDKFIKYMTKCCKESFKTAYAIKKAIEAGLCPKSIVERNLSLENPVPFINENKKVYINREYGVKINPQQRAFLKARYLQELNAETKNKTR